MTRPWERFFFICTYIAQGSSYMSPAAYAIMHRMHHAYTDTDMDPHSPQFSKNLFGMMWRTRQFYVSIFKGKMKVEERFTKNLPSWPVFDKLASSSLSRIIWAALYTVVVLLFSPTLWFLLLLPVMVAMGAFHGAVINWFAHKYGYVNFKLKNTSQNLLAIDMLMLGESYHNNHHKNPSSVNFGKRWHEIDPVYPVIRLLSWCKIIKLPATAPASRMHMPRVHE
ncbi:fatty acid desaturase [Filimonas zeae]|uniref:Fatty acid desaturase n=2 Tax=Filimonas zeae TaxID=1737353 RepID=A0A917J1H2_9BACT|nr:fatty acid desaturase [Filimonas zeae]